MRGTKTLSPCSWRDNAMSPGAAVKRAAQTANPYPPSPTSFANIATPNIYHSPAMTNAARPVRNEGWDFMAPPPRRRPELGDGERPD